MTRIEWTRLEGADVEAVVAMLLNREQPNSTRITPSRGDGGVDILDRNARPNGSDVVYQVKRYTEPLGQREKGAVEASLKTLMNDPRWATLRVEEWHLVLPWDPSPEAEKWLQDFGEAQGVSAVWDGLARVEALASKYPDVIDYYLHGGRSRIEEAYKQVAAAFGAAHTATGLSVAEVQDKVGKALLTLEHDPHYRYEHRFGSGDLPAPSSRPGLVLHLAQGDSSTGRWSTVDVIARCEASVVERPIVIKGSLQLKKGSAAEAFQDFIAYGSPFKSPDGAFSGELDAPGGLGESLTGAMVSVWSPGGDLGDNPELHIEAIAPDGQTLAAVELDRTDRSRGKEGVRVVLTETNGVFTIEDMYNLTGKPSSRKVTLNDITGKPVTGILPALSFLTHCRTPNVGRVSHRYTLAERGVKDANLAFQWPADFEKQLREMTDLIEVLARLQANSATVIRVPDFASVHDGQPESWLAAVKILNGEEVTRRYEVGHAVQIDFGDDPAPVESFVIRVPLQVIVGDQEVELGEVGAYFDDPVFLGSQEVEGRTFHALQTPGRRIRYRLLSDD